MPFLYGNHVVKAHLGKITEDTPEHQGVVVFSMTDVPLVSSILTLSFSRKIDLMIIFAIQGFGVTARSTVDTRKLDPTSVIVFNQARVLCLFSVLGCLLNEHSCGHSDVGEYLRDEDTLF